MTLSTTPLHPLFAVEVIGLDLSLPFGASAPFGEATTRALREALRAHRLLVFRGQRLSAAEQVAFTRTFGAVDLHAVAGLRSAEQPEIVLEPGVGAAGPDGFGLGDLRWHADQLGRPGPTAFPRCTRTCCRPQAAPRSSRTNARPSTAWTRGWRTACSSWMRSTTRPAGSRRAEPGAGGCRSCTPLFECAPKPAAAACSWTRTRRRACLACLSPKREGCCSACAPPPPIPR